MVYQQCHEAAQKAMRDMKASLDSKPRAGPSKGAKSGYGEFMKHTAAQMKRSLSLDPKRDLYDGHKVHRLWAGLPAHEKRLWEKEAERLNTKREQEPATGEDPTPKASTRRVQLVGNDSTFLSEDEYKLCRQLDTWECHQQRWTFSAPLLFLFLPRSIV